MGSRVGDHKSHHSPTSRVTWMSCSPPAKLQKMRSWAGGPQDGFLSGPHRVVLHRKQQMSGLWLQLQSNHLLPPQQQQQVKRKNLQALAFLHRGWERCAPWCMTEWSAVMYLLTKDCIKNKSWKATNGCHAHTGQKAKGLDLSHFTNIGP